MTGMARLECWRWVAASVWVDVPMTSSERKIRDVGGLRIVSGEEWNLDDTPMGPWLDANCKSRVEVQMYLGENPDGTAPAHILFADAVEAAGFMMHFSCRIQ